MSVWSLPSLNEEKSLQQKGHRLDSGGPFLSSAGLSPEVPDKLKAVPLDWHLKRAFRLSPLAFPFSSSGRFAYAIRCNPFCGILAVAFGQFVPNYRHSDTAGQANHGAALDRRNNGVGLGISSGRLWRSPGHRRSPTNAASSQHRNSNPDKSD